jgi:hypothetical protein
VVAAEARLAELVAQRAEALLPVARLRAGIEVCSCSTGCVPTATDRAAGRPLQAIEVTRRSARAAG